MPTKLGSHRVEDELDGWSTFGLFTRCYFFFQDLIDAGLVALEGAVGHFQAVDQDGRGGADLAFLGFCQICLEKLVYLLGVGHYRIELF